METDMQLSKNNLQFAIVTQLGNLVKMSDGFAAEQKV